MADINIEEKLNDLQESSRKTCNVLNGMPDKNTKKQCMETLKEDIITTQALMTLKNQNKKTVTQQELKEAIDKEVFVKKVFVSEALVDLSTSMLISIAQHPDRLFSVKEQFKKEYPMYEKNVNLQDIKYVFDRKKPEKDIENYTTERSAALSIALLTLANRHQKDIDESRWNVEDFYSEENLRERSKVFDEVMDKIQKADHAWIAEQIYEGTKAIAKLSDRTAKDINWQVPDVLKDEKVLMLARLGDACFDCNQEMGRNCCTSMLNYIKEKYDEDIPIFSDEIRDSHGTRENIHTINKHMNEIHAEAHLSQLASSIETVFSKAMEVAIKKEFGNDNQKNFSIQCATAASEMELIHEIVGRVKAHNSVPSHIVESFDHLEIGDMPDLKKQVQDDLKNDQHIKNLNRKLLSAAPSEKQRLKNEKAGYIERKEQKALERKKAELTKNYPYENLAANDIGAAKTIFIPAFIKQMSPVDQDNTGTIGSNLMTDIASGEFSKTVGGHTPLKVNISDYGKKVETKIRNTIPSDKFIEKYGKGLEKNVLDDLIKENQPKGIKNETKPVSELKYDLGETTFNTLTNVTVSELKYDLGETTFNTLTNVMIHANNVILNTIETKKLLDLPPDQRQTDKFKTREREHLKKVWESHRNFLQNYDAMSRLDTNQFEGTAGNYLRQNINNSIKKLTGDPRGPHSDIGWIRGEKKAIENGWGLDELGLLGMIGKLDAASRVDLKLYDGLQQNCEADRAAFLEELASLKMNVWDKPVRNAEDKKNAVQQIRDFIANNQEKNDFTKLMFKEIPIKKVKGICQKFKNLNPEAQADPLNNLTTQDDFNKYFDSQKEKGDVQLLNAMTDAYSKNHKNKNMIEGYMRYLYQKGDEGKKYLLKSAKTLAETLNEQRKNVYERIIQISDDFLKHPDKVDKKFHPYLKSEPLRRQLAYNSIRDTESVKQMMAMSKLSSTMKNCTTLPDNYNNNIKDVINNVQNSKNKYLEYQFGSGRTFSEAIKGTDQLDLAKLKEEQETQSDLMEKYRNYVTKLAEHAKGYFNQLDTTLSNHDASEQSGDFIKMYNAVKAASKLTENSTPADVERAINQMVDSSNEYIRENNRKNNSFLKIFFKEDKHLLIAAENIQNLSKDASMELLYGLKRDKNTKKYGVYNHMTHLFTDKNKSIQENKDEIEDSLQSLINSQRSKSVSLPNNQPQDQLKQDQLKQDQLKQDQLKQDQLKRGRSNSISVKRPGGMKP